MDRELIERVADTVLEFLRSLNITTPITNIHEVVRKLNGRIQEDPSLPFYIDGQIKKDNDSFVINISPNQSKTRMNFTIAHELGHLFLHMGYGINEELWNSCPENLSYSRSGTSQSEKDANEFAANFLMPKAEFIKALDEHSTENSVDIEAVALYFGVSIDAIMNRGKWLGFFKW